MKIPVLCFLLLTVPVLAQSTDDKTKVAPPASSPGLDENTRLMQEYMIQRAELIALRQATLDRVKVAKTATEKKQHLDKLADDEKPMLTKVNEAARAYKAAEKTKRDQLEQAKPRG